ncbi:MAG: hypothetical protein MK105_15560 [Crocinitomicaceae bacterium]|nr:hypothetical protein [Crocinitomicaceae bacterium]
MVSALSKNNATTYRYGFQGYEADDEIKGERNSYTTEFRQYDSRLGRWLSIDPVVKEHESPYAAFANNPIWFVDVNGADSSVYSQPYADHVGFGGQTVAQMDSHLDDVFGMMSEAAGGDPDRIMEMWSRGKSGLLDMENPDEYKFGILMKEFQVTSFEKEAAIDDYYGNDVDFEGEISDPFSFGGFIRVDLTLPEQDQVYDILAATQYVTQNACESSQGACAKYVRKGFEAGGITTTGRPGSAADYVDFLPTRGFEQVSPVNYKPVIGDVYILDRGSHSAHGHIAMWNGTEWVSDFHQGESVQIYRANKNVPVTYWRR